MAITIKTSRPRALLSSLKEGMSDGTITTWTCDSDGDFTMSSDNWRHKAWFQPEVREDSLSLHIFPPRDTNISIAVYAVYHARFVEILLRYFDKKFQSVRATALPVSPDRVSND